MHDKVAFFDVTSSPGGDAMMLMPGAPPAPTVGLELKNCVARGEASFVQAVGYTPGDVFGNRNRNPAQVRGVLETGIFF